MTVKVYLDQVKLGNPDLGNLAGDSPFMSLGYDFVNNLFFTCKFCTFVATQRGSLSTFLEDLYQPHAWHLPPSLETMKKAYLVHIQPIEAPLLASKRVADTI